MSNFLSAGSFLSQFWPACCWDNWPPSCCVSCLCMTATKLVSILMDLIYKSQVEAQISCFLGVPVFNVFHIKCSVLSASTFTDYLKECDSLLTCCLSLDPDKIWICQTWPWTLSNSVSLKLCSPKIPTLCQSLTETPALSTLVLSHRSSVVCVRWPVNEELVPPVAVFWGITRFPPGSQATPADSTPHSGDKEKPKPRTLFPETWIWDLVSVGFVPASALLP